MKYTLQALISLITRKPRQMRRESKPVTLQPVRVILVGRPW